MLQVSFPQRSQPTQPQLMEGVLILAFQAIISQVRKSAEKCFQTDEYFFHFMRRLLWKNLLREYVQIGIYYWTILTNSFTDHYCEIIVICNQIQVTLLQDFFIVSDVSMVTLFIIVMVCWTPRINCFLIGLSIILFYLYSRHNSLHF